MLWARGEGKMKIPIWRKVLAVLAFWLLVFFGGSLVMLWNALSPSFAQYRPGDLGYLVLQTVATAAGAGIAVWAANEITKGQCKILYLVNCVVAATFMSALTFLNVLTVGASLQNIIGMGIAIIVLIVISYNYGKDITKDFADKEQIVSRYNASLPGIELLEEYAKRANKTVPEYILFLRLEAKKADGLSEDEAIRAIAAEDRKRVAALK